MVDFDALVVGVCMATFGEPVTYTAAGRLPRTVLGIFDYANTDLLPMGGAQEQERRQIGAAGGVNARRPILGVDEADFPVAPRANDTVYVPSRNLTFVVKSVQPDGKGGIMLLLAKAPGAPPPSNP